jgi:rubrerythrin
MNDSMERIGQALLDAMRAEHEGQHFYMMAAATTQDPKGKEIFEQLAREELEHAHFLRDQYRSLRETGAVDASRKLGTPIALGGGSPIFSDAIRDRLQDAQFEMTALAVAAQLELDAQRFYNDQAQATGDVAIKTFFLELAEWEAGHHRALTAQQDSLKEEYWAKSGFAPF